MFTTIVRGIEFIYTVQLENGLLTVTFFNELIDGIFQASTDHPMMSVENVIDKYIQEEPESFHSLS